MSVEPPAVNDLSLYVMRGCGYCQDVRVAIQALGLEIEERDVRQDPEHRRALLAARGRGTVPVLRIGDTWMGESQDIIAYLYREYGGGEGPPPRSYGSYVQVAMWGLLLGGGVAAEPTRSVLWTLACTVAAVRSFSCAIRTKHWVHWAVGSAFAFGALSIVLAALGIADLPWWYAAFAVALAVLGGAIVQRIKAR